MEHMPRSEWYMFSVWIFKPKAIERIIAELKEASPSNSQFTYDAKYNWFHVICHPDDTKSIKQSFSHITHKIEAEAFYKDRDKMLTPEGVLQENFETDLISLVHTSGTEAEALKALAFPERLSQFSHKAIWDKLDFEQDHFGTEPLIIHHIVTETGFRQLESDTGAMISFAPSGALVYLGANNQESIDEIQQRLNVLLKLKKTAQPQPEHLLFAEDYVEKKLPELTADARYMVNIEPKLASTTLLDRLEVQDLQGIYTKLYEEGCSIRLCTYDCDLKYHLSLLGPPIIGRSSRKYIFGNRLIATPKNAEGSFFAANPQPPIALATPATPATLVTTRGATQASQVSGAIRSAARTSTVGSVAQTNSELPGKDTLPVPDDLIYLETSTAQIPQPKPAGHKQTIVSQTLEEMTASTSHFPGWQFFLETEKKTSLADQTPGSGIRYTASGSLIELFPSGSGSGSSSSLGESITWSMSPLVPQTVSKTTNLGRSATRSDSVVGVLATSPSTPTTPTPLVKDLERDEKDAHRFRRYLESGANGFEIMNQQAKSKKIAQPLGKKNTTWVEKSPPTFTEEIHAAITRLLTTGPYLRGRVSVTAEFGRAILLKMDPSGLSYNASGSPSSGWGKTVLIDLLNSLMTKDEAFQFTTILGTFAADVDTMISTRDKDNYLWKENPTSSWTVYSFHCFSTSPPGRFIVDIIDDPTNGFSYKLQQYTRRLGFNANVAVYVHGLLRNWDLRIKLSHDDDEINEQPFSTFARALIDSLRISRNTEGPSGLELQFPLKSDFGVIIRDVRVATKWRYLSPDARSVLNVSEVEQLEVEPVGGGAFHTGRGNQGAQSARSWTPKTAKKKKDEGEFPRWYEASITSTRAEALFLQNKSLGLGQKAEWDANTLLEQHIFEDIYGPALQMLKTMDHVGGNDNSNIMEKVKMNIPRRNNPKPAMPGNVPVTRRTLLTTKKRKRALNSLTQVSDSFPAESDNVSAELRPFW
ncbi:hypothetical protein B0T26DRAFT_791920 [Lasiosphaeria miniovina]|uniref:Uncharacterized protein n=1 Tax=Lasiosphaeria miniovina TaxID=1954250 RepID=A0AA40DJ24_9PEZI|nr:uncharacterized protein B0T26DRAFT_791920 [Lasiosphaeria miniovina]KAK0703161.1 hypothetical protein B0T26DRAFT_791920 [Lasiosphaeria miniovina]